jgi:regulator of sigma E protease
MAGAQDSTGRTEGTLESKPVWRRSIIMLAGIGMNIVFGWLLFVIVFMVGSPQHLVIEQVAEDSPAALGGVMAGDVVMEAVFGDVTLQDPISSREFIDLTKKAGGTLVDFKLRSNGTTRDVALQGRPNPPEGQGSFGILLADTGFASYGFFPAIGEAVRTTGETLWLVAVGLVTFFGKLFLEPKIIDSVAGPVGIFSLAARAGTFGIMPLLHLIAFISLNIAVLNFLPFPALDGGRFLFLLIEKIKGSPVSIRVQTVINVAGFVLLLGVMILITVKDIGRLFAGV